MTKRTVCPVCGFSRAAIPHEKKGDIQAEITSAVEKGIPILCSSQTDANSVRSSAVYLDAKLKVRQRKGKEGIYVTIKKL